MLGILQTSNLIVDLTEWEYGREGLNYPEDAFIFRGEEGLFICIRKEGILSIEENLRHEFDHIIKGEISACNL